MQYFTFFFWRYSQQDSPKRFLTFFFWRKSQQDSPDVFWPHPHPYTYLKKKKKKKVIQGDPSDPSFLGVLPSVLEAG